MRRWVLILAALVSPAAFAEPMLALQAEGGTFEEAFALDGAGGRLALVRADAAGAHVLELVDVGQKGAVLARVPLGDAAPASVTLSPAGIFVVMRDAGGAVAGATLYDLAGKALRKLPPATDALLRDGTLATYSARGGSLEVVREELRPGARPVRRTFSLEPTGEIAALELTPQYWRGGYAQLVGRRRGRYDKAKDRLMNDSDSVYDVARGAIVRDLAPPDLVAWARLRQERSRRWNVESFVYASEDGAHLSAVTADDQVVALDVPMAGYEASSLQQQELADGRVVFSLTVDPLNPEALARQKRDPERVDVFRLDAGKVTKVLSFARDGRDFIWRASATRLALLRKHRAYGRGGPVIEIYDLAPGQ